MKKLPWIRRAITGLLGAALIIDSLVQRFEVIPFVVGLVMVGLIPVDVIVDAIMTPKQDEEQIERLRQVMRERDEEN